MLEKIKRFTKTIKDNPRFIFLYFNKFHLLDYLSDKSFHSLYYWMYTGKKLNTDNPKGFNEKLQWMMIYDHNPIYTKLSDKYRVREFVEERVGKEYLIPLLGVYDNADEIDFSKLPDQFVLKCNHNSGVGMCICRDKSKLDIAEVRHRLNEGLKVSGYDYAREWSYKNIEPKIVCEKLMIDEKSKEKGIDNLIDYKIYCFDGEPKFLYLCYTLEDKTAYLDFYDFDFKGVPFYRTDHDHFPFEPEKPECFDEMLEVAKKLSNGFPFVRVDLYSINNKVYFSEMTFTPGGALSPFKPEEWENKIGDWLILPQKYED